MKTFLYNLIFSLIIALTMNLHCFAETGNTYVSLAPALTEIIYAIKAEKNLTAVTSFCDYPEAAQKKPKIGNALFINKEALIGLKPSTILAIKEQKPFINDLKALNINIYYFSLNTIEDIHKGILDIGKITGNSQNAVNFVTNLKIEENKIKAAKSKKIFYVVQAEPLISIGSESYIADIIRKSGHHSITEKIKYSYPKLSLEYAIAQKPDIVVVRDKFSAEYLRKYFKAKFVILTPQENQLLSRPGPRILDAAKFISKL